MNPLLWHKVAGVSGMAALGLGTYGAHGFKPQNAAYNEVWRTASLYHLVHTAALIAAPMTKYPNFFGGLLTTGILAFSGTHLGSSRNPGRRGCGRCCAVAYFDVQSCYTVAYLEDRSYAKIAPFGGFAFIAAWASLLF